MRINVELQDLRASGRLWKLAQTMGWNQRETIGALVQFWGATQDAEIVETTHAKLMTTIILDMDSDDQAERFVRALIAAQLVESRDSLLLIKGNEEHVGRLKVYRDRAYKGGIAKNKKANDFVASKQLGGSHKAATPAATNVPSLAPLLLSSLAPNYELQDPQNSPDQETLRRTKKITAEPTPIGDVRRAFLDGYAARYPNAKPYPWGAKENGQTRNLLKSMSPEDLKELFVAWFAWDHRKVIQGGHSFGTGSDCFVWRYIELFADTNAPERRIGAAIAGEHESLNNAAAAEAEQTRRVIAELQGSSKNVLGHSDTKTLTGNTTTNTTGSRGLNPPITRTSGNVGAEIVRRGDHGVDAEFNALLRSEPVSRAR